MGCLSRVGAYIKWHYSDVTLRRSEKQLEREKKFLGCIPFNRWFLVPAAVTVQLCIGSLYSWSIYNIPIETELGLAAGTAANTFYISVGFFGFSAALFGPILERRGPQIILLFSTTMMYLGHIIAAVGVWVNSIGVIYLGYGVFAGIGFGVSYITPVSPLQKWFPDYKGLLSGLAVCGFGGGSMIASKAENKLITQVGVAETFIILGSVYAACMYFCVLVLRCPPPGYYVESPEERKLKREQTKFRAQLSKKLTETNTLGGSTAFGGSTLGRTMTNSTAVPPLAGACTSEDKKADGEGTISVPDAAVMDVNAGSQDGTAENAQLQEIMDLKEPTMKFTLLGALFTRDYLCMYVTLACNSCAGLMILSKMADIMQQNFHQSKDFAANIVMINSGFNLLGRLCYGAVSDRIGQKPIFIVSLFCQAIIMGVLPTLIQQDQMWVFISLIWILASFYGGGFGLMPAFLTAMFGSSNIGALHGIVLTAWSLVGVIGGLTFTKIFKSQVHKYEDEGGKSNPNVYNLNFYLICAFIVFGFFFVLAIRTSMRERLTPRRKGELIRMPFFNTPIIFGYKTQEQQMEDWVAYLRTLPENQPGANNSINMDDDAPAESRDMAMDESRASQV